GRRFESYPGSPTTPRIAFSSRCGAFLLDSASPRTTESTARAETDPLASRRLRVDVADLEVERRAGVDRAGSLHYDVAVDVDEHVAGGGRTEDAGDVGDVAVIRDLWGGIGPLHGDTVLGAPEAIMLECRSGYVSSTIVRPRAHDV